MFGEDCYWAGAVKGVGGVGFDLIAHLHPRRANWHAGHGDPYEIRFEIHEKLDVGGRYVTLNDIIADHRGVAGPERRWNAQTVLDLIERILLDIRRGDVEASAP